jgi:cation diffusion facilitator family transporter
MQAKSSIQWDHSHDFGVDNTHSEKKVIIVFWLTTVIMILEITAGTWSGSMALLADGWHMGTHSAAFLIAMFAYSYAKKHTKNKTFSFGAGKVNYLGGFASAVALALVALMMILESMQRLIEPQQIHFNEAIIVAIIGLIVNVASVFVLHDSHHHHDHAHGHDHSHKHSDSHTHDHGHHHDHNMKAAYLHVLADTLTSLLAIVALLAGKYFGWVWMDAVIGMVGAAVIGRWSYGLIKESSDVLLDKTMHSSAFEDVAQHMKAELDTTITDIHVWRIGASDKAAILSVSTNKPRELSEYKQVLTHYLPQLSHVSVEVHTEYTHK